ncbi:MAG: transcriptional regulator [Deltaproteobacteria bacterium]|nr:transcriptional regulator [Deltaproteobacteria bacterium]
MDNKEFHDYRQKLNKTQKQMAEILGVSLKAVQSFEQGWREVPVHVERQIYFLLSMKSKKGAQKPKACWDIRKCSLQTRENCPAWEFNAGYLCWFINGTLCQGKPQESWARKMKVCRRCAVFASAMNCWKALA